MYQACNHLISQRFFSNAHVTSYSKAT